MEKENRENKLTGEGIHGMFCELMECEPKENLEVVGCADIEYFHRLQSEDVENGDIVSQYKETNDGVIMYVNEDVLNMQPYQSVDIILAQLFDIYIDSFDYYMPFYTEANRFWFIKSAPKGFNYWLQFSSSYMSFLMLRLIFEDVEYVKNEYPNEVLKEQYIEILKELPESDADIDVKISTLIYLLGRLSYLERIPDSVKTAMQLKKIEILDMTVLMEGKTGILCNALYKIFVKSIIGGLKIQDFMKINKLVEELKTILDSDSEAQKEKSE